MTVEEFIHPMNTNHLKSVESEWLVVGDFVLASGRVAVSDPALYPDGLIVGLPIGIYIVLLKILKDEETFYVSSFRISQDDKASPGEVLGEISVDFGQVGVVDHVLMQEKCSDLSDADMERVLEVLESDRLYAIADWNPDANVKMPFVRSGYGDGRYSVWNLVSEKRLCGVQVNFITEEML